jgi:hypothetical protein
VNKESIFGVGYLRKLGTMRTSGNAMVPGADMAGLLERHVCCSSERFAAMCDDADLAAGALSACHIFYR